MDSTDLASLLTPPAPGFADRARAIWSRRADLQEAFPVPETPELLRWMGVHGVREHPDELAGFYPEIPPEHLRHTACGGLSEDSHLYTGVEDFRAVGELYEVFTQKPLRSLSSVYDFGCGCGRLLRWFALRSFDAEGGGPTCIGSDVRRASIAWCAEHLPGRYFTNDVQPPLDLPDASVELTVSLSTFSHFNLASNHAWIRELARVTRPDGLILITTHGALALALVARSPEHQQGLFMPAETARDYLRRLVKERFLFHAVPADLVEKLDGPEADYGQAFFNEAFVMQEWEPYVELLGCVPVGLNLFQDFYALRPRG